MRLLVSVMWFGLIAGSAQAQFSSVGGPSLGFSPDNAGTSIRPIIGIPGASMLAGRLALEADIRGAVISPKQDYAIAARSEDGQLVVVDLRSALPTLSAVTGAHTGANVMSVSPTGSVAAVYDDKSRTVQVIGHPPEAPEVIRRFDASRIAGVGTGLAVSDDGTIALMRFVEAESAALWVLDSSGAVWQVSSGRPSAFAFFPNRTDAIVAEDATQTAFLMFDVAGAAARVPLISAEAGMEAFAAVATSEDGRRVFLADANSGNIAVVDVETRMIQRVSCQCRVTGFHRLKGSSVFRLSEASREPMMVLDASGGEPRIVVIPPNASEVEAQ